MSLQFSNDDLFFARGQTNDDNYIHQITISAEQVDYLRYDLVNQGASMVSTWRLATVSKDVVTEGRRKENALWRVWAQQRQGLQKISTQTIPWSKSVADKCNVIMGPVVDGWNTCHTILALANVRVTPPKPRRLCSWLEGKSIGQLRSSDVIYRHLVYPIERHDTFQNSSAIPPPPQRRCVRVTFDTCVLQREIPPVSDNEKQGNERFSVITARIPLRVLPPTVLRQDSTTTSESIDSQSVPSLNLTLREKARNRKSLKLTRSSLCIRQPQNAATEENGVQDIAVTRLREGRKRSGLKKERVKFVLGGDEYDDADGMVAGVGSRLELPLVPSVGANVKRNPLKREAVAFIRESEVFDNPDQIMEDWTEIPRSVGQSEVYPSAGLVGRVSSFGGAVGRVLSASW